MINLKSKKWSDLHKVTMQTLTPKSVSFLSYHVFGEQKWERFWYTFWKGLLCRKVLLHKGRLCRKENGIVLFKSERWDWYQRVNIVRSRFGFSIRILMSVPERVQDAHQVLKLIKTNKPKNALIHKAGDLRVDKTAFWWPIYTAFLHYNSNKGTEIVPGGAWFLVSPSKHGVRTNTFPWGRAFEHSSGGWKTYGSLCKNEENSVSRPVSIKV